MVPLCHSICLWSSFAGLPSPLPGPKTESHGKTFISVSEKGTRAGAATAVEMVTEGALLIEDYKTVTLDRPFVYMLIDCQTNLPFFIGTMMDVG